MSWYLMRLSNTGPQESSVHAAEGYGQVGEFNEMFYPQGNGWIRSKCVNLLWLPRWLSGQEYACPSERPRFDPWVEEILWRRKWQPAAVFLPGESHGQRSLGGSSMESWKSQTCLSTHACTCQPASYRFFLLMEDLIYGILWSLLSLGQGHFSAPPLVL